jgi:MFS family permease
MFSDPVLTASLAMSALVSTVMMATLVVGPFYLSRALGLQPSRVGLVLSAGPMVAALAGVPAGRFVDRLGARRTAMIGLGGIAGACLILSMVSPAFGVPGYIAPIILMTSSYALFQAANNTAIMNDVRDEQRGVVSGLLSLSRNLGLITGASAMGAVFAFASGATSIGTAGAGDVAVGLRVTFTVGAALVMLAFALARGSRRRAGNLVPSSLSGTQPAA